MTFNLSPQYYKSDRDFGVGDALTRTMSPRSSKRSIRIGTVNKHRSTTWRRLGFGARIHVANCFHSINSATSSLDIYNEEMQDPQIISALSQAAQRGVNVEVDMTDSSEWKSAFQTLAKCWRARQNIFS